MTILIIILLGMSGHHLLAQETAGADSTRAAWTQQLVGVVSLTQVAYKDWTQGGEDALAWITNLDGRTEHKGLRSNWATSYKFAFGQSRIKNQAIRKIEDKIDITSVYTQQLGLPVNPFVSATLKTQFSKGFTFNKDGTKTAVSDFFDPAYLTQSVGLGYRPTPRIRMRFGIGVREILTSNFNRFSDNPDTPGIEEVKVDGGFEPVIEVEWPFGQDFLFTTKIELFSAFKQMDELVVRSDHRITARVNKYISTSIHIQIVRDKTAGPFTQVQEAITLGLSYSFI